MSIWFKTVIVLLGAAAICWLSSTALAGAAPAPEEFVVRIQVACQEDDPVSPWKRRREEGRSGYGIVIAPGRILTTADIVKDATLIKVEKRRERRYYGGRVEAIDYDADLALLSVEDGDFFSGLVPVELEEAVEVDGPVQFLAFEEPDRIRAIPGTIVRVSVEPYFLGEDRFLAFGASVNFEDRPGGWSEPVVSGGRLAGLNMTYNGQRQYAVIIPAAVIARFLEAVTPEGYLGLPHEGFASAPARVPALRNFLGLDPDGGGVYVTSVFPRGSAAGVLREGDVILSVGGRTLDADGYYEDQRWGRLDYRDIFTRLYRPGDRVELELVREGEPLAAEMVLKRWELADYLVPPYGGGEEVQYLIAGGAVFQDLTLDYLRAWGSQWRLRANRKFYYHYLNNSRRTGEGRERIVILNRVLPDEVNLGYQGMEDLVLASVNGRPVGSLADVAEALLHPERGFHRFTFEEYNREIVFRVSDLEEADARISRQYGISRLRRLR